MIPLSTTQLREFYSGRWNWRHAGEERMRFRTAMRLAQVRPGSAVLDVGSKNGDLRGYLPIPYRYQGMDIAPEFAAPYVLVRDVCDGLPFEDAHFDYVFLLEVLEHTKRPCDVLTEVYRVLRPSGLCLVSVPNPYHVKELLWNLFGVADRQGHCYSWTKQTITRLGQMCGLVRTGYAGTYLTPPLPAPALLARSICYRFAKL